MKIPTRRIDLGEIGYEGYWIDFPRSLRYGFIYELSADDTDAPADDAAGPASKRQTEQALDANLKLLAEVVDWNLTDRKEKPLKTIAKCRGRDEMIGVISEVPIDVVVHLANQIGRSTEVAAKVEGF